MSLTDKHPPATQPLARPWAAWLYKNGFDPSDVGVALDRLIDEGGTALDVDGLLNLADVATYHKARSMFIRQDDGSLAYHTRFVLSGLSGERLRQVVEHYDKRYTEAGQRLYYYGRRCKKLVTRAKHLRIAREALALAVADAVELAAVPTLLTLRAGAWDVIAARCFEADRALVSCQQVLDARCRHARE